MLAFLGIPGVDRQWRHGFQFNSRSSIPLADVVIEGEGQLSRRRRRMVARNYAMRVVLKE